MKKNLVGLMLMGALPLLVSMSVGAAEIGADDLAWQLRKAVFDNDLGKVKGLIAAGADVNRANELRMSPLITAASKGNSKIVDELIKAGANVNAADKFGDTPLMTAALGGHSKIVNELIEVGADPSKINIEGNTAIDLAKTAAIRELLQKIMREQTEKAIHEGYKLRADEGEKGKVTGYEDLPPEIAQVITEILIEKK